VAALQAVGCQVNLVNVAGQNLQAYKQIGKLNYMSENTDFLYC